MTEQPSSAVDSPLISSDELLTLVDAPHVRVLDVRGRWSSPPRSLHEEYLKGHIPGATFVDWTQAFLAPGIPMGSAPLGTDQKAASDFQALGIHADDEVVIYDDYHHMFAGRLWWTLRYWGHDKVRVLDGGWSNWQKQSLPISTDTSTPAAGSFTPKRRDDLRVDMHELALAMASSTLVDARGRKGYQGNSDDKRSGHIPGALNLPWSDLLDDSSGRFLEAESLQYVLDQQLPTWRQRPVISSCGSGYSGTVLMLALKHLGVESPLFDDSFAVWKQDPSRPVARDNSVDPA